MKWLIIAIALTGCSIPLDKQKHFGAGVVGSGIAYLATDDPRAAWATAAAMGAAKEAYDATGRGNVEAGDFLATVAGAAVWHAVHCMRDLC